MFFTSDVNYVSFLSIMDSFLPLNRALKPLLSTPSNNN